MKKKTKTIMILILSIFLIFCSGITYSIFHSGATMNSSDQAIAKFVFNASLTDQLQFNMIDLTPGEEEKYEFSVSNNYSGNTSEVNLEYQMIIKTYHLVPLIIELYSVDEKNEETLLLTCEEEGHTRNEKNELEYETDIMQMPYDQNAVDNYKIKIKFPEEYNDLIYSELVDYLNIEIKSWQKISE